MSLESNAILFVWSTEKSQGMLALNPLEADIQSHVRRAIQVATNDPRNHEPFVLRYASQEDSDQWAIAGNRLVYGTLADSALWGTEYLREEA